MQLFWAHARWAREEINAAAGKNCAKKRERIFKKLDRLRAITAWQYCDKDCVRNNFVKYEYFYKFIEYENYVESFSSFIIKKFFLKIDFKICSENSILCRWFFD